MEDFRATVDRAKAALFEDPSRSDLRIALAELYREQGYPDQAGRWGALEPGWATEREQIAFARLFPLGVRVEDVARVLRVSAAEVPEQLLADVRASAAARRSDQAGPVTLSTVIAWLVGLAVLCLVVGLVGVFLGAVVGWGGTTVAARVVGAVAAALAVLAILLGGARGVVRRVRRAFERRDEGD